MKTFTAVVRNGRLVLDEPTELPEGTLVELVYADDYEADPFVDMSEEKIARLDASLAQSKKELAAGKGIPAEDVLRKLRAKR